MDINLNEYATEANHQIERLKKEIAGSEAILEITKAHPDESVFDQIIVCEALLTANKTAYYLAMIMSLLVEKLQEKSQ